MIPLLITSALIAMIAHGIASVLSYFELRKINRNMRAEWPKKP
jgi:hypothetical protein